MMDKHSILWNLFFEKLLQNMNNVVMVTNSAGNIVFANEKYLNTFHLTRKDIFDKFWIENIIPEVNRPDARKVFLKLKKKKILSQFDAPAETNGGLKQYISWTSVPLKEKRSYFYLFIGRKQKGFTRGKVKNHTITPKSASAVYKDIIEALFASSRVCEAETAKHAIRVMAFAVIFAKKLKISKRRIEKLKVASLLHDLGKLAVNEKVLFKKGRLNKKEFAEIKKHPGWGSEAVNLICFLQDIIPIMADHHENYDGTGYPKGIKGNKIPLEAKVLCVSDIYEALTADRPYRKGFNTEEAVAIMESEKGRKLDPKITDIFLDMVKKGKFKNV